MTGLYFLIIFILGAALGIAVWVYLDEKDRHRGILDEYERVIDGLSADVSALKEQVFKGNIAYIELELGRDEQDTNYQQIILDHQDKIDELLKENRMLNAEMESKKNTR